MTSIHQLARVDHRIDLNLFRVFRAVAELGSTSAAAHQLHLTQSAVSHALGRLRQQVGDPLLVKQGRGLVLTPHGRDILPKVSQALNSLQLCQRSGGSFNPASSDLEFHLGFRDLLEAMVLPQMLSHLEHLNSSVSVASFRVTGSELESRLLDGEVDLVVDMEQSVSEQIASQLYRNEPLAVVVGEQHPSYLDNTISMDDYVSANHVLVTLERTERTFVEQRMQGIASKRNVQLYCESYFAAVKVVAATRLLLTMPQRYAEQLSELLPVKVLPLPFPCDPLPVRLYWRRANSEEPAIHWLLKSMIAMTTAKLE
ncbi:LysR family transcriptional regulator [Ferrimonas lipolytica]|uniref:LysR family transcriptional regulator n=1 Tax=Ferrimonas lipolytica TaxID=2724191 RepID=A0A6H1UD13_9GAMM|nr:LysR family transcriptional regulator [Ferrimonas lipolytica]QIZ76096.1 LysR family transcriptional regulator [Ferrimonas lipolytica]